MSSSVTGISRGFTSVIVLVFLVTGSIRCGSGSSSAPPRVPTVQATVGIPVRRFLDAPRFTDFKTGDSLIAKEITLFTGLTLQSDKSCYLAHAQTGGFARSDQGVLLNPVLSPEVERSFPKCNLFRGVYIPYADDAGPVPQTAYYMRRFKKGQIVFGLVVLADGTSFPTPCRLDEAPQDGTIHFDTRVGSISAGIFQLVDGSPHRIVQLVASPMPSGTSFDPKSLPLCKAN